MFILYPDSLDPQSHYGKAHGQPVIIVWIDLRAG